MHSGQERTQPSSAPFALAGLFLYLVLAVALFADVWSAPAARWIGIDGDPDSTIWTIQWVAFALTHNLNPFLSDYIFYPTGLNLTWSNADAPVALAIGMLPVTLTLGPVVAYNVLQTLAFGLSAWTASLAIRRFVPWAPAAIVGGLVYGFGPYAVGQAYGHMALTFGVVPPLLVILLDRLLVRRDAPAVLLGLGAGLLEAFQLLVAEELVVAHVIVTAVGVLWLVLLAILFRWPVPWVEVVRRSAIAASTAAVTFLVVDSYPLYLLLFGPDRITKGPVRPFGEFVTDLYNLVIPPGQTHFLHNDWTVRISSVFSSAPCEAGYYLGIGMVVVVLFTSVRWLRTLVVDFRAAMLATTIVLSMGPRLTYGGHQSHLVRLPWILMRDMPIINEVLVERMAAYADLFAGVLLAFFLDRAWRAKYRGARPLGVLAAAAALAFLVPTLPWHTSDVHLPTLFQPGTAANTSFRAIVPSGGLALVLPANVQVGGGYATLWQPLAGFTFKRLDGDLVRPAPDGSATLYPPPSPLWSAVSALQDGGRPATDAADLDQVRAELASLGVKAIVVGPMPNQQAALQYFELLLGRPPDPIGGVLVWATS